MSATTEDTQIQPDPYDDAWEDEPITPRATLRKATKLLLVAAMVTLAFAAGIYADRQWGESRTEHSPTRRIPAVRRRTRPRQRLPRRRRVRRNDAWGQRRPRYRPGRLSQGTNALHHRQQREHHQGQRPRRTRGVNNRNDHRQEDQARRHCHRAGQQRRLGNAHRNKRLDRGQLTLPSTSPPTAVVRPTRDRAWGRDTVRADGRWGSCSAPARRAILIAIDEKFVGWQGDFHGSTLKDAPAASADVPLA